MPSTDNVALWIQALEATFEPAFITLDEIHEGQPADDSLQPVIQTLKDQVQPPHSGKWENPEDARILLSQLDSLVFQEGVLYCKFHYPDGSTNFLRIILLAELHRSCIERLHANLGYFGRVKTCMAVSHCVNF